MLLDYFLSSIPYVLHRTCNDSVLGWGGRNCDKGYSTHEALPEGRPRPSLKYT